ncbi:MAG: AMP-binding protein [Tenacibaculum sp.]
MKLYDLIYKNKNLRFLNISTEKYTYATQFHKSLKINNFNGLVFIYSNNQIDSIEVFLNFLESDFAISLLNRELHVEFKCSLEQIYQPYYIYDPLRIKIKGYKMCFVSESIVLHKKEEECTYSINKKIKLLLSTSGTTGTPKFVKLSDDNLVKNAISILDYMPVKSDDIVPLNIPINYVYGLSIFTTNCIKSNTVVCTNKDYLQKEFWDHFNKYKFSTLSGVPSVYEILIRIGFFKKEHKHLRYMTQAGGKLSKELVLTIIQYSKKYNTPFYTQYGQTEASGRMSFLHPYDLINRGYSIGKPIKGGSFEIVKDTDELVYYGDNVFGGYARRVEDLQTFNQSNKLFTGDIAKKDKEGYYYITGRIKRIIKLFGTRINLDEVEIILKDNLKQDTFICTGVEDKYLAIAYTNNKLAQKPIKSVLKDKLNINSNILKIFFLKKIPLTQNGKINYLQIQKHISLNL